MSEDTETAPLKSEGDAGDPMVEAEADQAEAEADQLTTKKGRPRTQAIGEVLGGKRIKKVVERLEFQTSRPQEKVLKIEDGGGDKLGDIPWTNNQLLKMKPAELKPLHIILFERPGKVTIVKRNIRLFNGFTFEVDSQPYIRRKEKMIRSLNGTQLRVICKVLDLKQASTKAELIDSILTFLISPKNRGKKLPKKRKSKKLSGSDSKAKAKKKGKSKSKSTSASPKKAKSANKSKAIVMDSLSSDESSSDDDKDEADEKAAVDGTDSDSEKEPMEEKESESDSEKKPTDSDEDEAESPVSKKSTTAKRQRAPAKKMGPPKKKAKRELSDESEADSESEPEEKPKKKKADKKATPDSSSNSKKTKSKVSEDSSDDDKPLIKMVKKPPSDEQLTETVQKLLKEADLEEMTMKQICQKVYDTYPDIDLTSRKDYIKQTVKSLIS